MKLSGVGADAFAHAGQTVTAVVGVVSGAAAAVINDLDFQAVCAVTDMYLGPVGTRVT